MSVSFFYLQKNSDQEVDELKQRLEAADERLTNQIENSDALIKSMGKQMAEQKDQLDELNDKLDRFDPKSSLRNCSVSCMHNLLQRKTRTINGFAEECRNLSGNGYVKTANKK